MAETESHLVLSYVYTFWVCLFVYCCLFVLFVCCLSTGPVLDEEMTLPITVGNNIIILQLELENGSIPANDYVIRQSTNLSLPITQLVESTRAQFIQLDAGTRYIFRIYARSADGTPSLPVQVEWVAGVSSRKSMIYEYKSCSIHLRYTARFVDLITSLHCIQNRELMLFLVYDLLSPPLLIHNH